MSRAEALKKDKSFYAEEENGNWYVFGDNSGFAYQEARSKEEADKMSEEMNWRHAKNKNRWGSSKMAHKTKPASELKSGDGWVEADGNVLTIDKVEDKGSDVVVHFKQEHMNHIKPSTVKKTKKVVVASELNNRIVASELVKVAKLLVKADTEYQTYFKGKLKEHGVSSPDEFKTDEEKKKFFDDVKKDWHG